MIPFVLCTKYDCPHASECYRLRASPDDPINQRYEPFIGLCNEEDEFHFFIRIRENDIVLEMEDILKNIKSSENKCLEIGVCEV